MKGFMNRLGEALLGRRGGCAAGGARRRRRWSLENLEVRELLAGDALPVLLVIADNHDFYYQEYGDTRASLEAAGVEVRVAATTLSPSTPHPGSGQGFSDGVVTPDVTLAEVNVDDYSAIAFVGGWGAAMYQYDFPGSYSYNHYNGDAGTKQIVNNLISDFLAADKHVAAICHATTVLAWARVDGVSPLAGKQVSVPYIGSPAVFYAGQWYGNFELGQYEQVVANGAIANTVSGQYGDPTTAADDVIVDGRIITAENYDSAAFFGQVLAAEVIAATQVEPPPPANTAPVAHDAVWQLAEHTANGTVVGMVAATDDDPGQTLSYAIFGGNVGNAFAIDAATGAIVVANSAAVDFETQPVFHLLVLVSDDGEPSLSDTAVITIELLDVVEPPPGSVHLLDNVLLVQGTAADDTIYIWSGAHDHQVFVWMNGEQRGRFELAPDSRVVVRGGDGNDRIFATDARRAVEIYGEGGHDLITGGSGDDTLIGGPGVDRIYGIGGNNLILGGDGDDHLFGGDGDDVIVGGAGNDAIGAAGGRNVLIGGAGHDRLHGGGGEDLLIGGSTDYDHDVAALHAIREVWAAPEDVADRVAALTTGEKTGVRLVAGDTVHADGAKNVMLGGGLAVDWFFAQEDDRVYGDPADLLTLL